MIARLTFYKFLPEQLNQVKKIYNEEVVPVVRKQKGNISIKFLEPMDKADELIVVTEWENQKDADQYDASGIYKQLVSKVKSFTTKEPVLRSYTYEAVGKEMPAMNR